MTGRYYSLLGLEKGADKESIKQAFRRLALVFHPDKGSVHRQRFSEICEAYHALMAADGHSTSSNLTPPTSINHIQTQRALTVSKERRFGKRGSPGDRRFETVLEAEYKGLHLKVRA